MRLNFRQIEAFRYVFQTGSMTAAGELMGITQPAISRLIRDLEAETELILFDRSGGRLHATPQAVSLFQEVERSYRGLDRIARAAQELRTKREETLSIAANVAPSFCCLPNVLGRFRTSWPNVKLSLNACSSPEILELVATQICDVGIAVVPNEAPGVVIEKLPAPDAVCVLAAANPLTRHDTIRPEHLDNAPLLMLSEHSLFQQRIYKCFEAAGIRLNVVFESSVSAPICAMVGNDAGVAILDPLTARAYASNNIVLRPFRPAVPFELKTIYPARRQRRDLVDDLIALFREEIVRPTPSVPFHIT